MKVGLLGVAIAAAAFATIGAASAQVVTGTVNVTGSVAAKCAVIPGESSTFGATFDALELAKADGTLRSIAEFTTGSTIRVHCTSIPNVSISASPLANLAPASSGYANSISYTALADFHLADSSTQTISAPSGGAAGPSALTTNLANANGNVVVRANAFATPSPSDLLVAGNYSGVITVTITP